MQSHDTSESAENPIAQMTSPALTGRTALVTGASRGLGRALVLDLVSAGARVVAVARSREALEAVGADAAGRVEAVAVDLGDRADRRALADSLRERGDVSILINNAATVEPLGQSWSTDRLVAADAYELNVLAPAELAAAVIPGMATAGWGRIVNISSGVVARPEGMVGGNTYVATKAALEAHTLNLAAELGASGLIGVTANIYRPGVIDTAMQEWIRSQDPNRIGHQLRDRFNAYRDEKALITPAASAAGLMRNLTTTESGAIWNVATSGR